MKPAVVLALAAALGLVDGLARAQELLLGAQAEAGTGLQGGGRDGTKGVERARTVLRLGADGRVDEEPKDALRVALLVEIEPTASAGAYVAYQRVLGDRLALDAGLATLIAPETLFGPSLAATLRFPVSEGTALTVAPTVDVYLLGSDLPKGTVLWQGLLLLGVRTGL